MLGLEPEIMKTDYELDYYTTRTFTVFGTQENETRIFERILNERKAAAVIVISANLTGRENIVERYKKAGIHVVFVEGKNIWGHRVHYDNEMAPALAVNHLVSRRKKKIGLLTGSRRYVQSFSERTAGFIKAMNGHNLKAGQENIFEFMEDGPELHRTALNFFLKNGINAVYCAAGENFAVRMLEEARKMHLSVPDDLAIVSQDDFGLSYAAEMTAIRQPAAEMGRKAVELAVMAIKENDLAAMKDEMFYPELIIRKST